MIDIRDLLISDSPEEFIAKINQNFRTVAGDIAPRGKRGFSGGPGLPGLGGRPGQKGNSGSNGTRLTLTILDSSWNVDYGAALIGSVPIALSRGFSIGDSWIDPNNGIIHQIIEGNDSFFSRNIISQSTGGGITSGFIPDTMSDGQNNEMQGLRVTNPYATTSISHAFFTETGLTWDYSTSDLEFNQINGYKRSAFKIAIDNTFSGETGDGSYLRVKTSLLTPGDNPNELGVEPPFKSPILYLSSRNQGVVNTPSDTPLVDIDGFGILHHTGDIGNILFIESSRAANESTIYVKSRVAVDGEGGFVAYGGPGGSGVTGAGNRMMWVPDKAAFRAGGVNGAQWNDANIGPFSIALGHDVTASVTNSISIGSNFVNNVVNSIAFGINKKVLDIRNNRIIGDGELDFALGSTNIIDDPVTNRVLLRNSSTTKNPFYRVEIADTEGLAGNYFMNIGNTPLGYGFSIHTGLNINDGMYLDPAGWLFLGGANASIAFTSGVGGKTISTTGNTDLRLNPAGTGGLVINKNTVITSGHKFEVIGNTRLQGNLRVVNGTEAVNNVLKYDASNGSIWGLIENNNIRTVSLPGYTGIARNKLTADAASKWIDLTPTGTFATLIMNKWEGAKVGIGTDDPLENLDVTGSFITRGGSDTNGRFFVNTKDFGGNVFGMDKIDMDFYDEVVESPAQNIKFNLHGVFIGKGINNTLLNNGIPNGTVPNSITSPVLSLYKLHNTSGIMNMVSIENSATVLPSIDSSIFTIGYNPGNASLFPILNPYYKFETVIRPGSSGYTDIAFVFSPTGTDSLIITKNGIGVNILQPSDRLHIQNGAIRVEGTGAAYKVGSNTVINTNMDATFRGIQGTRTDLNGDAGEIFRFRDNRQLVISSTTTETGNYILIENTNGDDSTTTSTRSGVFFKNSSNGGTRPKASITFQRNDTFGRGDLYFNINNTANNFTQAQSSDWAMIIRRNKDVEIKGNLIVEGDITGLTSDKNLKDDILTIENSLDIVKHLRPVSFNWNQKAKELDNRKTVKEKSFGLIAQEVEELLPEIICNKYVDYKGIEYEKLIPFLIGAIQDQQKQIDELKQLVSKILK